MKTVAVAIIHGVGKQDSHFATGMIETLRTELERQIPSDESAGQAFVFEPVYWAPALQRREKDLWQQIKKGGELDFLALRRFMVDFAADAIAYQPTPNDRQIYDNVHATIARSLCRLAEKAGPTAPLCVIAHSLGSVIASNYFYDLHKEFSAADPKPMLCEQVRNAMGHTPLERGETMTSFYSLGSPLAIWSLRYEEPKFGRPIDVPAVELERHHPGLTGEWVNFYDEDDVIGYPLKKLNDAYEKVVKKDLAINAGGFLSSWSPLSHLGYWTDDDVTGPIAQGLAQIWQNVNGP